jgi:hypothetical protein
VSFEVGYSLKGKKTKNREGVFFYKRQAIECCNLTLKISLEVVSWESIVLLFKYEHTFLVWVYLKEFLLAKQSSANPVTWIDVESRKMESTRTRRKQ